VAKQAFYFSDGPYLQALQGLHAALSGSEAFVKFIGQPHTGKSGVCAKLAQYMRRKDYRVIYFENPIESPDMLRSMLAKELDIPDTFNIVRHLEDALSLQGEKPLIIIFDDAHLISEITLIEIFRLSSVQVREKRAINIVLCGEPELEQRISNKQEFNSLRQHFSHNFLLRPMSLATTSQFLDAFLKKMGLPGLRLEEAALAQFYKSSKGFPAPAYSLSQLIYSLGKTGSGQRVLTKEELLLAIRNADGEQPIPTGGLREGSRWLLFTPLAAALIIASLALLLRQLSPPEPAHDVVEIASLLDDDDEAASSGGSPFADEEFLLVNTVVDSELTPPLDADDVTVADGSSAVDQRDQDTEAEVAARVELQVSDSNLSLVTAQERGISAEAITEPLFEDMSIEQAAAQNPSLARSAVIESPAGGDGALSLANAVVSRPMLALDDEPLIAPELQREEMLEAATAVDSSLQRADDTSAAILAPAEEGARPSPRQAVQRWLDAWEGQDLEVYFASYADEFVPRYHRSRAAWLSNRERVIGNASEISLEISEFMLISEDAESVEVHFWLTYRSPSYQDDTRKKLILKKLPASDQSADGFEILEEINLEVRV